PDGRAHLVARPRPRALGSASHPSWSRGPRARRGIRRRPRPVRAPGLDRRLPRAGAYPGRDGLDAHRRALRYARPAPAVARRGAESRGRARDGVRTGCRPRDRQCVDLGALAPGLSPLAERARRPSRQARPLQGGARGVRARRIAHPKHARAQPSPRARGRVRARVGTSAAGVTSGWPDPTGASLGGASVLALREIGGRSELTLGYRADSVATLMPSYLQNP